MNLLALKSNYVMIRLSLLLKRMSRKCRGYIETAIVFTREKRLQMEIVVTFTALFSVPWKFER